MRVSRTFFFFFYETVEPPISGEIGNRIYNVDLVKKKKKIILIYGALKIYIKLLVKHYENLSTSLTA